MRHSALRQAARETAQQIEQAETVEAKGNVFHTAWKWIPKSWRDALLKKKAKPKAGIGGQDETVTLHPDYGEVSVGKGVFKTKAIEVSKGEIMKFVRTLKPSQVW